MTTISNLITCLDRWCDKQPDTLLYAFYDSSGALADQYTYLQMSQSTKRLAQILRTHGLHKGDRVIIALPPGLCIMVALLACARIGVISTIAPITDSQGRFGPALQPKLARMVEDCTPKAIILTNKQFHLTEELSTSCPGMSVIAMDRPLPPLDSLEEESHEVLLLQYTSGSTHHPKGVIVRHDNVIENALAFLDYAPVTVSWLPQFHDMGLIGSYLFPLILGGCSHTFTAADFLRRPSLWLRLMSSVRATCSSAPDFAFDYCLEDGRISDDEITDVDLRSVRILLSGGEPVKPSTCKRFRDRFRRYGLDPKALVAAYGLAEATLAVTAGSCVSDCFDAVKLARGIVESSDPRSSSGVELACCGLPLGNVQLSIRSQRTAEELGAGEVGEICLRGPSITSGYWQRNASSGVGRGVTSKEKQDVIPYMRTGDMGFMMSGQLYLCGRVAELIIRRGANYYAGDIERAMDYGTTKIRGRVVYQDRYGMVTAIVETRKNNVIPDTRKIAQHVFSLTNLMLDRIVVVPPRSVMRTTSGKIARTATRIRFEKGRLCVLADDWVGTGNSLAQEGAITWLEETVRKRPDVARDTISESGIDSLQLVQLQLELEEGVRIGLGVNADGDIDGRLLQHCTCGDILTLNDALRKGDITSARILSERLLAIGAAISEQVKRDMVHDCAMPLEWIDGVRGIADVSERIIVIGATGFLGPFLLNSLIRQTTHPIVAIVRGSDDVHAYMRVEDALQRANIYADTVNHGMRSKLTVWRGDISEPLLGLSKERYEEIVAASGDIYHNAAHVDYVRNYAALRGTNVIGTKAVLQLALSGRAKRLHYVSTTFVFGWTKSPILRESDCNENMIGLDFGYSQSKWVAEQLVFRAIESGLRVSIYRPSLISVSQAIAGDPHDIVARLVAFMIRYGIAVEASNQISLLPVDLVAHNIVAIARKWDSNSTVLHITADEYYSFTQLTRQMTASYGFKFEYYDIASFVRRLRSLARPTDPVYPLLDFLDRSASHIAEMVLKRYDNTNYRLERERTYGCEADPPLVEIATRMISFLMRQEWISADDLPAERLREYEYVAESR